jgi:hypothetical protein
VRIEARLDLAHPRDLGKLLGDGLGLYRRHLAVFLALAASVVLPVEVIVFGLGLEQLASEYDSSPPVEEQLVAFGVTYLVITPLITAMTVNAVIAAAEGRRPRARESIMAGLDAFAPVFFAVVLAGAGIALGLLLLVVPGLYAGVRWYFVPQCVVVEERRGATALRASWELVAGSWWRVFGIVLLTSLIVLIPVAVIQLPFQAAASRADASALTLAGSVIADTVATPYVALVATLLYFDLRARRADRREATDEG